MTRKNLSRPNCNTKRCPVCNRELHRLPGRDEKVCAYLHGDEIYKAEIKRNIFANKVAELLKDDICLASYSTYDLKNSNRLHAWYPKGIYAIGNGPIRYITRERYMEYIREDNENDKK